MLGYWRDSHRRPLSKLGNLAHGILNSLLESDAQLGLIAEIAKRALAIETKD